MDRATTKLWRIARRLSRAAARRKAPRLLPPLIFVTDPDRTPDPAAVAEGLPQGAAVIYRAFGAPDAEATARALRRVADRLDLTLLIGADEALAEAVGADGVHLPQRMLSLGVRLRCRHRSWILTGATHDAASLALAHRSGLDAALLSPVFGSRSRSAKTVLGPVRFTLLVRHSLLRVYALGGVSAITAPRLLCTGAFGLAAVDGLSQPQAPLIPGRRRSP